MNMTNEELRDLADLFLNPDAGRDSYTRPHVRPGVLVATDGRCLLHVEDPAIAPAEGDEEPKDSFMKFRQDGVQTIAGPRKIEWLAATLVPVYEEARRKIEEWAETFDLDPEGAARADCEDVTECPCCGQRLIVSNGEAQTIEQWAADNRPDEGRMRGLVVLEGAALKEPQPLALRYIGKALYAARKLGGAERLDVCEFPTLALRGPGWDIYIARRTDDHTYPGEEVTRIRLDKEAANA
jgi:hypothetical protein